MKLTAPIALLIVSGFALISCDGEEKTETAQGIVNASINFHDPHNNWNALNANFIFESKFSFNDSVPEELHININVPANDFKYHNLDRKVNLRYNNDSCEVLKGSGTCGGYSWTKNFYTYVWGLPMKLQDSSTTILPKFTTDTIRNTPVYIVSVNYENENFKFYFNQNTYELKFFGFIKNTGDKHGEFISLSGLQEFNGIKFPKHRRWEKLLTEELIGTNEVLSITN